MKKEIVLDLEKDDYCFSVNSKTPGTYSFKVAFVSAKETFAEAGDNTYHKIEIGETYKAQLGKREEYDGFTLKMKESGTVTLKITSDVKLIGVSNSHPVSSGGSIVRGGEIKKGTSEIVFEMEKGSQTISFRKKKGTGNYSFKLICHHNWKTKSVDKASLTAAGKLHQKCGVCGETKTVAIKKVRSHKLTATTYTYDGKIKTPSVVVRDTSGKVLKKGVDYSVTYSSGRMNPGEYKATVKMKGNYTGTKALTFKILPGKTSKITATSKATQVALKWSAVKGASGYKVQIKSTTSGATIKTITTTATSKTIKGLKAGTKYKVIVTAYKTFNGTKVYAKVNKSIITATATATPKVSVTTGTKAATVKWNKPTGVSGYEVYMATSKGGTYKKIYTTAAASKLSYKKSDLTVGKTYYFKVRAYKLVEGKKIYSDYSAVQSAKIK